jgi:hypothetical protein
MRKLTLNLDSLAVQSFETTPADAAGRGTVLGRAAAGPEPTRDCSMDPNCVYTDQASCKGTCDYNETCYDSCYGSCGSCIVSCPGTCAASCGDTCPYCVDPTTKDPVFD